MNKKDMKEENSKEGIDNSEVKIEDKKEASEDNEKREEENKNKDEKNIESEEKKEEVGEVKKEEVKKENNDKEKFCETFEVDDKSGEHEIVTCNSIPKKHSGKKELASHNIILRNILIVLGLIIIVFIAWMIFLNIIDSVKYDNLSFEVVNEGNIIFYKHVLPLYNGESHYANYNFYLRKNPYKTGNIPFDGELNIREFMAINSTDFSCDGDEVLAMANLIKPFEVADIEIVYDPNATCDEESRYILLNIQHGEENKIVQTGETCYDMIVKDCDILAVSEKMMIEMFILFDEANSKVGKKTVNNDLESTL